MGLPTILVYRVSELTYLLSKVLVHLDVIGLPNIIMGHKIMPEIWEHDVTPENIAAAVLPLLQDPVAWQALSDNMKAVRQTMGSAGVMERTASSILQFAKEKQST